MCLLVEGKNERVLIARLFIPFLFVLLGGQALMQAPKDSISSDLDLSNIYAGEYSSVSDTDGYQAVVEDGAQAAVRDGTHQNGTHQDGYRNGGQSGWRWQMGTAITGTAVVSAGLALPFVGKQAITVPIGQSLPPEQAANGSLAASQANRPISQQAALDQGKGISPQVAQASQAAFSVSAPGASAQANGDTTYNTVPFTAKQPLLSQQTDGSWSLSGNAPSGSSQTNFTRPTASTSTPASTSRFSAPAIVSQLAAAVTGSEPVCLANSCGSLAYIEAQLPKAQRKVQTIQQQLDDFAAQRAQGDITAYRRVLSDRMSEVSEQQNRLALELVETDRYVAQLELKLAGINLQADLARHLLSVDTGYQMEWLRLKQVERQLLGEFSKANLDAAPLNKIYSEYEEQQAETFAAAEAVLGNYLLDSKSQPDRQSLIYTAPAALDILQALTVAMHQQDAQQLRHSTVKIAEENLQRRQRTLAQDLSQYESLQQELRTGIALVKQYEQTRAQIGTEASATATAAATAAAATPPAVAEQASPTLEAAKTLEEALPDGNLGKMVLGIIIAAGAMAVAAQRRGGGVSKAIAHSGTNRAVPTVPRPEGENGEAIVGGTVRQKRRYLTEESLPVDTLAIEVMSRELDEMLGSSTVDARFKEELQERAIATIQLPFEKIDALAESAVRWVLKDLSSSPQTDRIKTAAQVATDTLSLQKA